MSIRIDEDKCAGCGACMSICPGNLIDANGAGRAYIKEPRDCWGCAACLKECPSGAILYYLAEDIGGQGTVMHIEKKSKDVSNYVFERGGKKVAEYEVDLRRANRY